MHSSIKFGCLETAPHKSPELVSAYLAGRHIQFAVIGARRTRVELSRATSRRLRRRGSGLPSPMPCLCRRSPAGVRVGSQTEPVAVEMRRLTLAGSGAAGRESGVA